MVDDKLTMLPAPCACIARSSCLMLSRTPSTLVSKVKAHVAFVANVGANEFGFRAKRAKLLHQSRAGIIAATGNDDAGAITGEGECGGPADAGQRAGNEDNLLAHVTSPSSGVVCLGGLGAGSKSEPVRCRLALPLRKM
jgi:hypothetical protein